MNGGRGASIEMRKRPGFGEYGLIERRGLGAPAGALAPMRAFIAASMFARIAVRICVAAAFTAVFSDAVKSAFTLSAAALLAARRSPVLFATSCDAIA